MTLTKKQPMMVAPVMAKPKLAMPKLPLCDMCKLAVNYIKPLVDSNSTEVSGHYACCVQVCYQK